jgi:hypothetical protein
MDCDLGQHHHVRFGRSEEPVFIVQRELGAHLKLIKFPKEWIEMGRKASVGYGERAGLGIKEGVKVLQVVGRKDKGPLRLTQIRYCRHYMSLVQSRPTIEKWRKCKALLIQHRPRLWGIGIERSSVEQVQLLDGWLKSALSTCRAHVGLAAVATPLIHLH